ncbi:MAG: hypothetical protein Q7J08_05660 [Methanocorpusculum sp.]|jgi:Flp pilus assembly protein TadB|uniref:hypothetical protein n=1 Tax=Methanocorpusculum sp. TaxID=2058474 RepID=UPI002724132D|nr:hypothetical protein [Methanocorpusculum sp.]MDO9523183.1 hypothetical protein [Methanocorpusculum sp.]
MTNNNSIAKKAGKGLAAYLTDWKNLLAHALLGCLLLLIAIIAPVPIWTKLVLIICLVTLNILRMRWSKARNAKKMGEI